MGYGRNRDGVKVTQMQKLCHTISGLRIAQVPPSRHPCAVLSAILTEGLPVILSLQEYKRGASACSNRQSISANEPFFRRGFEICRRFKITNPVS